MVPSNFGGLGDGEECEEEAERARERDEEPETEYGGERRRWDGGDNEEEWNE